jgi:hypothetical protein
VLFGIGSGDVSGGLFDAITGKDSNSGGSQSSVVTKRIKADEKKLKLNPRNTAALADLVRSHYQLATEDSDQTTGQFGEDGKAELQKAASAWERYTKVAAKPDAGLSSLMLQAYSEIGLNDNSKAAGVAEIVANARPSAQAYLLLTTYAAKAGQIRKATLAGQKAEDLAPKSQKKAVQAQVKAALASGGVPGTSG